MKLKMKLLDCMKKLKNFTVQKPTLRKKLDL